MNKLKTKINNNCRQKNILQRKDLLQQLVEDIKKKRELAAIDNFFVLGQLKQVLNQNYRLAAKLNLLTVRSADYKKIVKLARARLRNDYGLFRTKRAPPFATVASLVQEFKQSPSPELLNKIMQQHSSTAERLPHYGQLYQQLFSITSNPKTILDLGCGLNPFSILFMGCRLQAYYAYDLSPLEIESINQFLRIIKVKGKARVGDIAKILLFPRADAAFLFKMTDILDQGQGHKKTEEMLRKIPAKHIIISFATVTMSSQHMRAPRRRWVEWLCRRLNYSFSIIEIPNEIFYVIKKPAAKL